MKSRDPAAAARREAAAAVVSPLASLFWIAIQSRAALFVALSLRAAR